MESKKVHSKNWLFWGKPQVAWLEWKWTGMSTAINKHGYSTEYKVSDKHGKWHTQCNCIVIIPVKLWRIKWRRSWKWNVLQCRVRRPEYPSKSPLFLGSPDKLWALFMFYVYWGCWDPRTAKPSPNTQRGGGGIHRNPLACLKKQYKSSCLHIAAVDSIFLLFYMCVCWLGLRGTGSFPRRAVKPQGSAPSAVRRCC